MTNSATQRNWWNNEAFADERYRTLAWGGDGTAEQVAPTIDAILENLRSFIRPGITVVELGAGPGRIINRLARMFPDTNFVAVDISEAMISLGVDDRPNNVMTKVCDGTALPDDVTADLIYSVEVFQHLDAHTKQSYLTSIRKCLTDDGVAVIQYVEGLDEDVFVCHPETAANMRAFIKDAGLKLKKTTVPNRIHDEWRWLVMQ